MLTAEPAGTLTLGLYDIDKTTEVTSAAVGDRVVIKGTFARTGTVNPVLSGHSKVGKTKILMTNGSLMKVKSIVECSPWSILQYF